MSRKISGLQNGERVVVRTAKGRFTKFKSDRKLVFEVRDKKGKFVRFLNRTDRKTRKPIPQKLSSFQMRFLTAKRTRQVKVRQVRQVSIMVNSRTPIIEHLLKKGAPIIKMVRAHLRTEKAVLIYADLSTDFGEIFRSPMVVVGKRWRDDEILKAIAIEMIVNPVREQSLRMSPKKYARSDKERDRREIKKAKVTVYVAKF